MAGDNAGPAASGARGVGAGADVAFASAMGAAAKVWDVAPPIKRRPATQHRHNSPAGDAHSSPQKIPQFLADKRGTECDDGAVRAPWKARQRGQHETGSTAAGSDKTNPPSAQRVARRERAARNTSGVDTFRDHRCSLAIRIDKTNPPSEAVHNPHPAKSRSAWPSGCFNRIYKTKPPSAVLRFLGVLALHRFFR